MRRMHVVVAVVALLAGTIGLRADEKTAARWFAHVEALANDGMEGRNTGSPAHRRAAEYVAARFQKAGLEPAGVAGYIQPVKLKTRKIVEAQSSLALVTGGRGEPLTLGEDANINLRVDPAAAVEAPLVFAGMDGGALSRAVGRPAATDRSIGGREIRRGGPRSRRPHREPRRAAEME